MKYIVAPGRAINCGTHWVNEGESADAIAQSDIQSLVENGSLIPAPEAPKPLDKGKKDKDEK